MSRGKGYVKMFTLYVEPEKWGFSGSCDDCAMSFHGRSAGKQILSVRAGRSMGILSHAHT